MEHHLLLGPAVHDRRAVDLPLLRAVSVLQRDVELVAAGMRSRREAHANAQQDRLDEERDLARVLDRSVERRRERDGRAVREVRRARGERDDRDDVRGPQLLHEPQAPKPVRRARRHLLPLIQERLPRAVRARVEEQRADLIRAPRVGRRVRRSARVARGRVAALVVEASELRARRRLARDDLDGGVLAHRVPSRGRPPDAAIRRVPSPARSRWWAPANERMHDSDRHEGGGAQVPPSVGDRRGMCHSFLLYD